LAQVSSRNPSSPTFAIAAALWLLSACGGDQAKRAEPDGNQPHDGAAGPFDGSSASDGSSGADGSSGGPHDSGRDSASDGDGDSGGHSDSGNGEAGPGEGGPHDASDGSDSGDQDSATPVTMMHGASLEVGRTEWGNDDATRDDVPGNGILFSVWTKIPNTNTSYPWSRGNMDVFVLRGTNWYFICLTGNMSAQSADNARYAANTMLFGSSPQHPGGSWVEDYGYYESSGERDENGAPVLHPEAPYRDWVWVAWWIVRGEDRFIVRQWLKFGLDGSIVVDNSPNFREVTFDKARELLSSRGWSADETAAWVPGDATSFQVGKHDGYLTHARMAAQNSEPTPEELDAIARHATVDTSAWADYPLVWSNGAPYLGDQSGHGHDLSLPSGGTLYAGPAGPSF
jgi:hypothetical protein